MHPPPFPNKKVLNPTIVTNRVQWNFRHFRQSAQQQFRCFDSTRPPQKVTWILSFHTWVWVISRAPVRAKIHLQEEKVICDLGDRPSTPAGEA